MIPESLHLVHFSWDRMRQLDLQGFPQLSWLFEHVGDMDEFQEDQLTTWHVTSQDGLLVYLFAQLDDALLFKLTWA